MRLARHGPKSGSSHECLIIALIWQQGPVLYKGDKGVNDAACPSEDGPTETGGVKSAIEHWPSEREAKQFVEKPLREAHRPIELPSYS